MDCLLAPKCRSPQLQKWETSPFVPEITGFLAVLQDSALPNLSKINKIQLKTTPYFNPGQIFALSFTEVLFSRVAEKVNRSTRNSSHVFIFLKVAEMEIIGLTNPVCLTIKSFAHR